MNSVAQGVIQVPIGAFAQFIAEANNSLAVQNAGNTYKNMYEVGSMKRGLTIVVLINICVALLGYVFFRYVIVKEAGPLTQNEIRLLYEYPGNTSSYTPTDSFVRAPPPYRWTGWSDYFTGDEKLLSSDGQIYLLFQRACLMTTLVCGSVSSIILLPFYWFGGALYNVGGDSNAAGKGRKSLTLLALLKSDRGVFELSTSHNLPKNSPLILLQLPVMVVVAFCVIFAYTVVKTSAMESDHSTKEWLREPEKKINENSSVSSDDANIYQSSYVQPSPYGTRKRRRRRTKEWTLFVRGLPMDIKSSNELAEMLAVIYPSQVGRVEIVCKGRMSEARLSRELVSAQYRYEYFLSKEDDETFNQRFRSKTMFGRIFSLFVRRSTREEVLRQLSEKISALDREIMSRRYEPVRGFRGCAFVTFKSSEAAEIALKHGASHYDRSFESPYSSYGSFPDLDLPEKKPELVREKLHFGVPRMNNLYKAIVDIMPMSIRDWIKATPLLAPTSPADLYFNHSLLVGPYNGYYSRQLVMARLRNMKAERAPKSADIVWDNIGISFVERTIREILVQFVVFLVLIVFTSPIAMLTAGKLLISELSILSDPQLLGHQNMTGNPLIPDINVSSKDNPAISISEVVIEHLPEALKKHEWLRTAVFNYVPVALLAVVFSVVPSLLRLTCKWEGYATHSTQELSVLRKTTFYYVMNSVILPSLALNTMSELLDQLYKKSNGGVNIASAFPILKQLFSGDIAFFLCNCLVQLSLTGAVFWLLRLPGSFSMMIRRRMAMTPLESAEAKCTDIFDYPRHYAYCVMVMSMCLLFGCMAPVIWWFSFLYFLTKHAVDLYKIRYVHPRSHIDGGLPKASVTFCLLWTVISQVSIAVVFYLQTFIKASIVCLMICILTLAACWSVGPDVGNRVMTLIRRANTELVRIVVGDGSNMFGWALGSKLQDYSAPAIIRSDSFGATDSNVFNDGNAGLSPVAQNWLPRKSLVSPLMSLPLVNENLFTQLVEQSNMASYESDYDLNGKRSGETSLDTRVEGSDTQDGSFMDDEFDFLLEYSDDVADDLEISRQRSTSRNFGTESSAG